MKPIPIFQIVRIDDTRVVIRHYNEEADKFEKICSAQDSISLSPVRDYRLLGDKLLITPDGQICYSHKGRLYYPGKVSELVTVLEATTNVLQMLDISVLRLPFRYLFIPERGEWFEEVISYKEVDGGLELQVAPRRWVKCSLQIEHDDDPDEGAMTYRN